MVPVVGEYVMASGLDEGLRLNNVNDGEASRRCHSALCYKRDLALTQQSLFRTSQTTFVIMQIVFRLISNFSAIKNFRYISHR